MSDLITKIVSKLTQKLIPNWRHVVLVSSAKNATVWVNRLRDVAPSDSAPDLAAVIIVCNFIKLYVEICILFFGGLDQALTCVGDAIASFLPFEDTQTCDMCLLSISEVSNGLRNPLIGRQRRRYFLSRPRWANTVS